MTGATEREARSLGTEVSGKAAALGLAMVAVLIRLPFASRILWDHDSIQFALGAETFDLAAHQPHPPGYPLYIAFLKVAGWLGIGPLAAMVALSVLAAGLGTGLMVLLGKRLGGEEQVGGSAGLLAGALYAFNPVVWFYSELPLVYAVEGGLTVAVAYSVLRMRDDGRWLWGAGFLMALAGGLRPSTLVLLAPLFLWGVATAWFRARLTLGRLLGGGTVSLGVVAAWLVPLMVSAGGWEAYRAIGRAHFGALLPQTSILYGAGPAALGHNLFLLAKWAAIGLLPGALVVAAAGVLVPGGIREKIREGLRVVAPRSPFLAVWVLPAILFFALFHVTKAGYTLVYYPALLVILALLAAPALSRRRRELRAALIGIAVLGGALFLVGRDRSPGEARWKELVQNDFKRGEIADLEADFKELLEALESLPPEDTALVTVELPGRGAAGSEGYLYSWHRHLQWYLPDYDLIAFFPEEEFTLQGRGHRPLERGMGEIRPPGKTRRLALVLAGRPDERLALPKGRILVDNRRFFVLETSFADWESSGLLEWLGPEMGGSSASARRKGRDCRGNCEPSKCKPDSGCTGLWPSSSAG